jgi:geranylgeranyl diphosphate synthase type I
VAARGDDLDPAGTGQPGVGGVVSVAAALELFHAAALVHDDIMDNSDLRRGEPSLHRRFETLHRDRGWSGDAAGYGEAAALLLGDLLLGWSDGLFEDGLARAEADAAVAARAEFGRMRTEVMLGQYLDMLEEHSWRGRPEAELLSRAHRVVVYKSAKYSVEAPLALGASLAGGSLAQLAALREFGLPLGVAFQLRDDLLGVFGDPAMTGKPSGDDLREGKRTVLIALARQLLPGSASRLLDELLGDPALDTGQIAMLQASIRDSGAVDQVERIIARNVQIATEALSQAPIGRSAREELTALADTVTRRQA